jgi:hypothetical protein
MVVIAPHEPSTLTWIRTFLLISLTLGVVGTAGELVLLGHIESPAQWLPLVALATSLPLLLWHAKAPGKASVRTLQLLMIVFIALGMVGVGLHYDGNAEFESELHPDDAGLTFLSHVAAGATPLLAPGSMVLLGLVGIAHTYRHPSATGGADRQETVS